MKKALAFDIGGTKIYSTVIDETGKIVSEIDKFSTPKTLDEIKTLLKTQIAKYENKEVRVYSADDCIYVNWYIDGRLIEKPRFPKKSVDEIYQFMESLHYKYICENLMYAILHTIEKHLPYLEDGDSPIGSLKYINVVGEVKVE